MEHYSEDLEFVSVCLLIMSIMYFRSDYSSLKKTSFLDDFTKPKRFYLQSNRRTQPGAIHLSGFEIVCGFSSQTSLLRTSVLATTSVLSTTSRVFARWPSHYGSNLSRIKGQLRIAVL